MSIKSVYGRRGSDINEKLESVGHSKSIRCLLFHETVQGAKTCHVVDSISTAQFESSYYRRNSRRIMHVMMSQSRFVTLSIHGDCRCRNIKILISPALLTMLLTDHFGLYTSFYKAFAIIADFLHMITSQRRHRMYDDVINPIPEHSWKTGECAR